MWSKSKLSRLRGSNQKRMKLSYPFPVNFEFFRGIAGGLDGKSMEARVMGSITLIPFLIRV